MRSQEWHPRGIQVPKASTDPTSLMALARDSPVSTVGFGVQLSPPSQGWGDPISHPRTGGSTHSSILVTGDPISQHGAGDKIPSSFPRDGETPFPTLGLGVQLPPPSSGIRRPQGSPISHPGAGNKTPSSTPRDVKTPFPISCWDKTPSSIPVIERSHFPPWNWG